MAIVPAAITIYLAGEQGTYRLLILSQVILSLQLPFAVIPLIHFTSDRRRMGAFANPRLGRCWPGPRPPSSSALNLRLAGHGDSANGWQRPAMAAAGLVAGDPGRHRAFSRCCCGSRSNR